jgi:serine palmitoyltransferase
VIAEWEPEAMVDADALKHQSSAEDFYTIESAMASRVVVNGEELLNFASSNFLDMSNSDEVKQACYDTIDKYGVGSCGPRGFYGSIDVHLEFEQAVAQFLGAKEAILYSDGIACVTSVIPAFSKRGDLIIADEGVNFSIQQGLTLSRATIVYYKHNDMADLRRALQRVKDADARKGSSLKLNRRFIVSEGISQYHGDLAALPDLVKLKDEFKYRLIIDDTNGFGVLGKTGRGSHEHWGIGLDRIDVLCASMDTALGTVGGWCVGQEQVVDHQRLSGLGYCFSASSPPYCSTAGTVALGLIEQHPQLCEAVRRRAARMRKQLGKIVGIEVVGCDKKTQVNSLASPVIHLRLRQSFGSREEDRASLVFVEESMLSEGVIVRTSKYIPAERSPPPPSLRIFVTATHTMQEIDETAALLNRAFAQLLKIGVGQLSRTFQF